jgi:hypothetical protein
MSKEFDPDQHHVKVRSMTGVHYEQDGCKFTSGFKYAGKVKGADKPKPDPEPKDDVRERARKKIAKKRGKKSKKPGLDGFRNKETPDAISSAEKEDEAARLAEEHA